MPQLIHFSDEARGDIRSIDRETALRVMKAIYRFVKTHSGDVSQLRGLEPPRWRLRVGDWRVIFRYLGNDAIEVLSVSHRSDAYR